jgi:pimeloyl-ACP methyl ester carboxylesterase
LIPAIKTDFMSSPSSPLAQVQRQYFTITGAEARPLATDLFLPKTRAPRAVVLYLHGINGFKDWGGVPLMMAHLAAEGLAVLNFNFSHNGTLPSRPTEFADLVEAYREDNYRKRQYDLEQIEAFVRHQGTDLGIAELPLYLIGHSRGGADALLYAAHHHTVAKWVTWSAPSHTQTPWLKWDAETLQKWQQEGVIYRPNGRTGQDMPIGYQLYEEHRQHRDALDLEKAVRALKSPGLIVHGEADEAVFVEAAYTLKSWCPSAAVEVIPDTGHTYGRQHPWESDALPDPTLRALARSREFLLENR